MNYTFESIAGYEQEKEELMRLCEIFNHREKYEAKGAKLPKGIVFYGGTGTGKTLFAKVMASVCGLEVFKIDLGDVENEVAICRRIRREFAKASRRKEPAMVFFDEVDKVLPNRNEEYITDRSKTILAQLLTLIDGMDSAGNIVFIATCNQYDALPETLTRPGRIDKKIQIGNPTLSSREAILKMYADRSSCRFALGMDEIAKLTNGFSCAGLETLVNECILQSDENGFVSEKLIHDRISEIKAEDIPRTRSAMDDGVRACRNIGAFVVAKTMNDGGYVLNLDRDTVGNDFFNGLLSDFDSDYERGDDDGDYDYDEEEGEEDMPARSYSKNDFMNAIVVCLGGYAAEEIVLHKLYENVKYDLTLADDILFAMSESGMLGLAHRYSERREEYMCYSDAWTDRVYTMFDEIIEAGYEKAKAIIEKNETLIRRLIPILVERQVLERKDCEPILAQLGGILK